MSDNYAVDFPVTLVLPPEVLNVLLAAAEELPHKVYKKVIESIHPQVLTQARQREAAAKVNSDTQEHV